MNTTELTLALIIFGLSILGCIAGAFFFGFVMGRRERRIEEEIEELDEEEVMLDRGYLLPSTGPIDIAVETHTMSIEIVPVSAELLHRGQETIERLTARVAELSAEVARQSRLRKRYLKLLREDRLMMRDVILGGGTQLTPYWRRWVHDHFSEESPFWLSQSWVRIANIG